MTYGFNVPTPTSLGVNKKQFLNTTFAAKCNLYLIKL